MHFRLGTTKERNKKCNLCALTKPHHEDTSHQSSVHFEVSQLLELTQKPCVLEDFGFTQPMSSRARWSEDSIYLHATTSQ